MGLLKHLKGIKEFWDKKRKIPTKQRFELCKGPVGRPNTYRLIGEVGEKMTFSELQKKSMSFPSGTTLQEVEKVYRQSLETAERIYFTDVNLSLSDDRKLLGWTIKNMNQFLKEGNCHIRGITTPYLYIGEFGSTFALHTEDADLYSLSILRYGAEKYWYTTLIADGPLIEEIATAHHPEVIHEPEQTKQEKKKKGKKNQKKAPEEPKKKIPKG